MIFNTNIFPNSNLKEPKPKYLHLGCGNIIHRDKNVEWINVDLYEPEADLKCDVMKLPFESNTISHIYSSHVVEHVHYHDTFKLLKEWRRVLNVGGTLEIETPDLLKSCEAFVKGNENERINLYPHFFGMGWLPGGAHLFLFTRKQLEWTLEQVGFKDIEFLPALRYIQKEHICLKVRCIK